MDYEWRFTQDGVCWNELSELYKAAQLGDKQPADLEVMFSNSKFKCFVYEADRLVGVGRALADGLDCSYICDVAVHSDCQGAGIGKNIISRLVSLSAGHKKIILYAAPGKEPFYEKLGFRRMKTAMAIFENHDRAVISGLISEF